MEDKHATIVDPFLSRDFELTLNVNTQFNFYALSLVMLCFLLTQNYESIQFSSFIFFSQN